MDQKEPSNATGVEFQLGVSKHANGKHWPTLGIVIGGIAVFTVGLPPDVADQLADTLPKELKNAANEARKLDNRQGLIVAHGIPEGAEHRDRN